MKVAHTFLSTALLLVAIQLSSSAVLAQSRATSGSTSYGWNVYSYRISGEDLMNTPSWNPEREDPPLPLRKGLEIARVNLRRFVKKADGFDVEKIDLIQMEVHKWLYEISFHCWTGECRDRAGSRFIIYVKMDGSIIEPEITPDEPKGEKLN